MRDLLTKYDFELSGLLLILIAMFIIGIGTVFAVVLGNLLMLGVVGMTLSILTVLFIIIDLIRGEGVRIFLIFICLIILLIPV